jgi:hypothetical protein
MQATGLSNPIRPVLEGDAFELRRHQPRAVGVEQMAGPSYAL